MTPEQREELRRLAEAVPIHEFAETEGNFDAEGYCDAVVTALLDALDAGPRSEERLADGLRAVDPHEEFYIGANRVDADTFANALRAALRTTEETSREPCPECGHPATHGPKDGEWAVVR